MNRYSCHDLLKAGFLFGYEDYWHDFIIIETRLSDDDLVIIYTQLSYDPVKHYLAKITFSGVTAIVGNDSNIENKLHSIENDWIYDAELTETSSQLVVKMILSEYGNLAVHCERCHIELIADWDDYCNITQREKLPARKVVSGSQNDRLNELSLYSSLKVLSRVFVDCGDSRSIVYLLAAQKVENTSVLLELLATSVGQYKFCGTPVMIVEVQVEMRSECAVFKLIDEFANVDMFESANAQLLEVVEY